MTAINLISSMKPKDLIPFVGVVYAREVAPVLRGVEDALQLTNVLQEFYEAKGANRPKAIATDMAYELLLHAEQIIEERQAKVQQNREAQQFAKMENRVQYLPNIILAFGETLDGTQTRWRGHTMMLSDGLMKRIENRYVSNYAAQEPVAVAVQNHLPIDEETGQQPSIGHEEWDKMEDMEFTISGARLAWIKGTKSYEMLRKCFPKHIELRSYNHSLNAPVYPGSCLFDAPVIVKHIKTSEGKCAGKDGSGLIHPKHPLFASMQRPGGACTVQIRAINEDGWFLKGVWVPDERAVDENGEPAIWVDYAQVKGLMGPEAKKLRGTDSELHIQVHFGVLNCWDRPRKLKWGFQQLQLLEMNETTTDVVKQWIEEAYARLFANGVDSMLSSMARKDERLATVLKFCQTIRQFEPDFSPMQIPMVKQQVVDRLMKNLYFIAQGAGKHSRQLVVVIDDEIEPGTCVVRGYAPGTEVISHRYPTVLPQGLVKLTVAEPLPHHLIGGKVVRETVFMHSSDIIMKMQGDDDGDIVGLTNDPRALALWENKVDGGRTYQIETTAMKFNFEDEREGLDYVRGNPMGPVGIVCLHQATMYAIGNVRAAIALALPFQGSVDSAKSVPNYLDFRIADDLEEWELRKDGAFYFNEVLTNDMDEMIKHLSDFVKQRLEDVGIKDVREENPIGWRYRGKRIDPLKWQSVCDKSGYEGGNLVHFAHDYAKIVWEENYSKVYDFNVEEFDISEILHRALSQHSEYRRIDMRWYEYDRTLRARSGLKEFNQRMYELMQDPHIDEEDRRFQVDSYFYELNVKLSALTVSELELIWRKENLETYEHGKRPKVWYSDDPSGRQVNNPNNAMRAVCHPNSPIMQLLGIHDGDYCEFLMNENSRRVTAFVDAVIGAPNPFEALLNGIKNSKHHAKECFDENGAPIEGKHCKFCQDLLFNTLISRIRNSKMSIETDVIRHLIPRLNNTAGLGHAAQT